MALLCAHQRGSRTVQLTVSDPAVATANWIVDQVELPLDDCPLWVDSVEKVGPSRLPAY
ncbi:hypothetical protein EMIT0324P_70243 [Pseudomonas chlororaphis]